MNYMVDGKLYCAQGAGWRVKCCLKSDVTGLSLCTMETHSSLACMVLIIMCM